MSVSAANNALTSAENEVKANGKYQQRARHTKSKMVTLSSGSSTRRLFRVSSFIKPSLKLKSHVHLENSFYRKFDFLSFILDQKGNAADVAKKAISN